MNEEIAARLLEVCARLGVTEVCFCPGARNEPILAALRLAKDQFSTLPFFEERSAAFFALGRARQFSLPVAVCTTSGTAAGELLPALMEAYYTGVPLIVITADRPRRFRGSGAPQAAEQVGLFGLYAPSFDVADADELAALASELADAVTGPLHLNVCFEDPFRPRATGSDAVAPTDSGLTRFEAANHPLAIVGELASADRPAVNAFLSEAGVPALLEPLSGLRESSALAHLRVSGDGLLARAAGTGTPVDAILRIGGVPTHRLWRDVEARPDLPVVSVSRFPFSGLGRPSALLHGSIPEKLTQVRPRKSYILDNLISKEAARGRQLDDLIAQDFYSEPSLFRRLSLAIPMGSTLFLGNSLPIREWDLAATHEDRALKAYASRGLNGIDGQISTFLGLCPRGREAWAVLGDLTTLYDLAAPWIVSHLPSISATLVVINNSGGRIFERMFPDPLFQNRHQFHFKAWAEMFDLPYVCTSTPEDLGPSPAGLRVVELIPDPEATCRFWSGYEALL